MTAAAPAAPCAHPGPCPLETTAVAARLVRVKPALVRTWAHRRWIRRRGSQGRSALWCMHQVRAAEAREQRIRRGLRPPLPSKGT